MLRRRRVSAKLEDYLEAILELEREKGSARVRDIAEAVTVHKSTVTSALRHLAEKHLVNYSPYELVTLTDEGRRIAEQVSRSHAVIRRFLTEVLLVEEQTAEANACRLEHGIDKEVLDRLVLLARFMKRQQRDEGSWVQRFADYMRGCGMAELYLSGAASDAAWSTRKATERATGEVRS